MKRNTQKLASEQVFLPSMLRYSTLTSLKANKYAAIRIAILLQRIWLFLSQLCELR